MDVIFNESPIVTMGGNHFNCRSAILQWEEEPLISVAKSEQAGYTMKYDVFHSDGTRIAVVKGCRVHITDDGVKAKVTTRNPPNLTVVELEGKPIIEMRRNGPAALKGWAEIYAPEGVFIKVTDSAILGMLGTGGAIQAPGLFMSGATVVAQIGLHFRRNGYVIGSSPDGSGATVSGGTISTRRV